MIEDAITLKYFAETAVEGGEKGWGCVFYIFFLGGGEEGDGGEGERKTVYFLVLSVDRKLHSSDFCCKEIGCVFVFKAIRIKK